ncbi:hypothetical protein TcBrA4_0101000 [Trypanosoma cruzi]|nr:hypothetical protein TcBrA4_0101000 [Trypanosoma cruzi]
MPPVARLTTRSDVLVRDGLHRETSQALRLAHAHCSPDLLVVLWWPFLVRHATFYGEQLAEDAEAQQPRVLLNTGYAAAARTVVRSACRCASRVRSSTRSTTGPSTDGIRGVPAGPAHPKYVAKVPEHLLNPRKAWKDVRQFNETSKELVAMFQESFSARFCRQSVAGDEECRPALRGICAPVSSNQYCQ